jgi:hypothetical protein
MKKLVIHPRDDSTLFLTKVYENLDDVTLVMGDVNRGEIRDMITSHDQIMMMGHGTPNGLLSSGQFIDESYFGFIIDDSCVNLLAEKDNSVFIWCNADKFVERNRLKGFYTGMFISEVDEAYLMGLGATTQTEVEESNNSFVETIGALASHGPRLMHVAARSSVLKYGQLASRNPVARYNHQRLYLQ